MNNLAREVLCIVRALGPVYVVHLDWFLKRKRSYSQVRQALKFLRREGMVVRLSLDRYDVTPQGRAFLMDALPRGERPTQHEQRSLWEEK